MPEERVAPSDSTASLYVGVMTGTSLDAIDVAICRFSEQTVEIVGFHTMSWPDALRKILLDMAVTPSIDMDLLTRTNFILAEYYRDAIEQAIAVAGISRADIRAVGLHGQTIRHLPLRISVDGLRPVGATYQLGSGSALAALLELDVVSDFRSADVALGGQGAPLVPMFDYAFLSSESIARLVTNIGGISNVTWLPLQTPGSAHESKVLAFDCGPGNMMIDLATKRFYNEPFDRNGERARAGQIDEDLLGTLMSDSYFAQAPPKSTGRELFGESYLSETFRRVDSDLLTKEDALATITEVTARCIVDALRFVQEERTAAEIIVSGGGAFNSYLLDRIAALAPEATVRSSAEIGIPPQAKEAVAFAFFAKARMDGTLIHLPSTTGASRKTILGVVSRG